MFIICRWALKSYTVCKTDKDTSLGFMGKSTITGKPENACNL